MNKFLKDFNVNNSKAQKKINKHVFSNHTLHIPFGAHARL